MNSLFHSFCLALSLAVASAFAQTPAPLTTVPSIELARYQGVWHQVALYPNRFQKMCASNTRATYALEEGGTVKVTNQCRSADGKEVQAIGQARPAGAAQIAGGQLTHPHGSLGCPWCGAIIG